MEIIQQDVLDVTIKFSLDEIRALKKSIGTQVSSSQLEDVKRALDYLTDKIENLDCKIEYEKAENTILLKNIQDDLERL